MVARWPVREGLLAYVDILKADAKEEYYLKLELYANGLLKESPRLPSILKNG